MVIVAVEGPSAAGKTTWCSRQGWPVVPEYAPTGCEPDGSDRVAQASYWAAVSSRRWRRAVELERSSAVVLCDSDPLKLHYSWCLARVGADSWARFAEELRAARAAFASGALGLADLVVVSIPPPEVLRRQCEHDPSRQRRSFALHASLAEPLRDWYRAVHEANVAQVQWTYPICLPAVVPKAGRRTRSNPVLLDRLLEHLPHGTDT